MPSLHCCSAQGACTRTCNCSQSRMTGVGKRGVGSAKSKKTYKQGLRKTFQKRHIDQVRCAVLVVLCIQCISVQA